MILEHTRIVRPDYGPRPFGKKDECFFCHQSVGTPHADGCVMLCKVVMVKIELTIPRVVPADWACERVDFHLNESSWCADNIVEDLSLLLESYKEGGKCFCGTFEGSCLRDATDEDLEGVDLAILTKEQ